MNKNKTIYLAGPISGLTYEEANEWREVITPNLEILGYKVLNPMYDKDFLKNKGVIGKDTDVINNVLNNHNNIYELDLFRVRHSDILLINFLGSKKASIGTVVEISTAHELNKIVIMIMEEDNVHNHIFITRNSIVVRTFEDAMTLLKAV